MIGKVVKIEEPELSLIKSVLGYPVVDSIAISDDEVKQFCITPALYQYFIKFPIPVFEQRNQQTTEEIIPFLDDETIGLLDIRTTGKTGFGQRMGNSSDFWQVVRFNMQYATNRGRTLNRGGVPGFYNPNGLRYHYLNERQFIDSLTNSQETFRYTINYSERTVAVFSTVVAMLDITWAKISGDFGKIKPTQVMNVIKLCQAYLLRHLSYLGSMMSDNNSEKQLNIDALNSNAERLENEVYELWKEFPDVVAIRMA